MNKYIKPTKDTVFPNPLYVSEICWKVLYNKKNVTENDLSYLSSVCSAYISLIRKNCQDRNKYCTLIKNLEKLDEEQRND